MRSLALCVLGLVVLAAAGCGGGGGPKRLSHADLVTQGNAICVAASGEIDRLGDPGTLADIGRIGAKLAAIRDAEATKLATLVPPKADVSTVARLIVALKARNETLHDVVKAARAGDQAAASKALVAGQSLGDTASNAALDLGLDRCAAGG
ncbi:MAG: hypothetical protein ABI317_00710 [Gaiellales bacterium]